MSINHIFVKRKVSRREGIEPASFRSPADRLTTRPSRLTEPASFRLSAERLTTRPSRLTELASFRLSAERLTTRPSRLTSGIVQFVVYTFMIRTIPRMCSAVPRSGFATTEGIVCRPVRPCVYSMTVICRSLSRCCYRRLMN